MHGTPHKEPGDEEEPVRGRGEGCQEGGHDVDGCQDQEDRPTSKSVGDDAGHRVDDQDPDHVGEGDNGFEVEAVAHQVEVRHDGSFHGGGVVDDVGTFSADGVDRTLAREI